MTSSAPPLPNIQSPESLRLGCFILDIKDIHQDTHEPFIDRPTAGEISINIHGSFHETQMLSKGSKFRVFLSDILSLSNEKRGSGVANLVAPQLTIHKLRNNSSWFEEACGNSETLEWFLKAFKNRYDVYLLVGFFILTDARLSTIRTSSTLGAAGAEASALPTAVAALGDSMALVGGVRNTRDVSYGRISVLDVPGDQIFGMWYRKVKFNWFFSREPSISLGNKTRWKPLYEVRGSPEVGEGNEVDGDDEEEPDMLCVSLEGDSDWEEKEEEEEGGEEKDASRNIQERVL
ncbi:uncharacterized protein H6S33_008206 [Morchella sextelata]|uniref:uncharacterized protein n=1 Tax=Morchella sextelata TaxID=1174677 RepID=UPI001D050207|nr:uncharacterized protein H6S33_008206 [Morchella sextelata]KAH0603202.1 hypothetical protein H6S33_008206 [Morchella sextelata]